MKRFYFLFACLICINQITAQDKSCEVQLESIKGTYTGTCVDGKAHGKGKSVGTDTYEGEFKNGYPDGFGEYTWQNQNHYKGNWKKGRMHGNGEMSNRLMWGDSTVTGFWKNGKYIGLYEKAYDVISTTSRISRVNISLQNKKGSDINITLHQLSGSSPGLSRLAVSSLNVLLGTYYSKSNQSLYNSAVTRITQVTFPFRAILTLSNGEITELLFNEKGDYDVYVDML